MKNFLLFNQLFGTEGSPNQTGKTLAPSDERAMTARRPRGEKEQLSPSCLLLASYLPLTCPLYLRRVAMILSKIAKTNKTPQTATRSADRGQVVAMMRQKCKTWKYVACMLLAFFLSIGQMWGM